MAAILAAYAFSLRGEFLWDDDLHISANPTIVGPLGLKEIWTSARANYFPLVLTNFWIQHALWDLNPLGYRLVTLLFHAGAALLLWRVLAALRVPGAWLGAALWALHPVQVESVAWICELKNTQSAVFFLAAAWCWLRWSVPDPSPGTPASRGGGGAYFAALGFGLLAILSKPSTVMLPVALALATWWRTGRIGRREVIALLPFFALSAVAAGWTIWEQKYHSGAIGDEWRQSLPERLAIAGRVTWFYLGKLAWPESLTFIYPRWEIDASRPLAFGAAAAVLLAGAGLWWGRRGRLRPVLFAGAYFVALLFPVLGFFSVYFFRYSFVGDHFQYLASMGPLALAGAALTRALPRAAPAAGAILLAGLGLATAVHARVFLHNEALWRDTVAKNPAATMAWLNLADTLSQEGRYEEATATYRQALALKPADPYGQNDLGNVLTLLGRAGEALAHFERALALKPEFPEAWSNYGNALRLLGRSDDAIAAFRRALAIQPRFVEARNNLGAELAERGRAAEAETELRAVLAVNPNHAGAHDNLGGVLRSLGRFDEALRSHREALRLKPGFAEAEANLARTLVAAGRGAEALAHFERALQLAPRLATVRGNYALALAAAGRTGEAFAQLERAVELAPESAEARLNLGTALAQTGRGAEAIGHFEAAVRLAPEFPAARLNLGTALGAAGRWDEAIVHWQAAATLSPENVAAHTGLAVALVNAGRIAAAVPVFEAALRLDPESAELRQNFGQVLRALGRNREALEQFERAAALPRRAP